MSRHAATTCHSLLRCPERLPRLLLRPRRLRRCARVTQFCRHSSLPGTKEKCPFHPGIVESLLLERLSVAMRLSNVVVFCTDTSTLGGQRFHFLECAAWHKGKAQRSTFRQKVQRSAVQRHTKGAARLVALRFICVFFSFPHAFASETHTSAEGAEGHMRSRQYCRRKEITFLVFFSNNWSKRPS